MIDSAVLRESQAFVIGLCRSNVQASINIKVTAGSLPNPHERGHTPLMAQRAKCGSVRESCSQDARAARYQPVEKGKFAQFAVFNGLLLSSYSAQDVHHYLGIKILLEQTGHGPLAFGLFRNVSHGSASHQSHRQFRQISAKPTEGVDSPTIRQA